MQDLTNDSRTGQDTPQIPHSEVGLDPASAGNQDEDDDPVERLLHQRAEMSKTQEEMASEKISILLQAFDRVPRLNSKENVLLYWESQKSRQPELYKLAMVALSVLMTQVTVERMFSHLKYILDVLRSSLAPHVVDDILLVRLNKMFMRV